MEPSVLFYPKMWDGEVYVRGHIKKKTRIKDQIKEG